MAAEVNDPVISFFEKIITIATGKCLACVDHFESGIISKPCSPNMCSYTASAIAIITFILDSHPDLKEWVIGDESLDLPNVWDRLGPHVRIPRTNPDVYQGIVNAVGLLWDVHDFKGIMHPKYTQYLRTGINFALDNKLYDEWFVNPVELQEGVNILSFYADLMMGRYSTIHHSFVYKLGTRCILIDSWNGSVVFREEHSVQSTTDDYSTVSFNSKGDITRERVERPLSIREYTDDYFVHILNVMTGRPSDGKIDLMRHVFLGYKNTPIGFRRLQVCILKQSKLQELIEQGFSMEHYMFGGKKQRRKGKTKKTYRR